MSNPQMSEMLGAQVYVAPMKFENGPELKSKSYSRGGV